MIEQKQFLPRRLYIFALLPGLGLFSGLFQGTTRLVVYSFLFVGLLGVKLVNKDKLKGIFNWIKVCPYFTLFVFQIALALMVQEDFQELSLHLLWLLSLLGYFQIYSSLPPLFATKELKLGGIYDFPGRIPKKDWTRKIWIPLLLLAHSCVYVLFGTFPLHWFMFNSFFLLEELNLIEVREVVILFSGSVVVSTFWVQMEYRVKRNFTSFIAKVVLWGSSWIGVVLFAPSLVFLILLLVVSFSIRLPKGNRIEKQADMQLFKIQWMLVFFTLVFVMLLFPMRRWQIESVEPEEWFLFKSEVIKSEPLIPGKTSSLTLEVTNVGRQSWYANDKDVFVQLWIVDTYYGEVRNGLPIKLRIPHQIDFGESFLRKVKLPVPFWFKKGGVLIRLQHEKIKEAFQAGNVEYTPMGFGRKFLISQQISPGLSGLIEEDQDGRYAKKHSQITRKSIQRVLSDAIDHVLNEPIWGVGKKISIDWKSNEYLLWVSMFGVPAGFLLSFMFLNGIFVVSDICILKNPEIKNIYLWSAFLLVLYSGFHFPFPMTHAGNLVILFLLSRLAHEAPVKREGFSLF